MGGSPTDQHAPYDVAPLRNHHKIGKLNSQNFTIKITICSPKCEEDGFHDGRCAQAFLPGTTSFRISFDGNDFIDASCSSDIFVNPSFFDWHDQR